MVVALRPIVCAIGVALLLPNALRGHAVVHPATAPPGAYQRYVLTVPTERDMPTTRIEIRFPEDVRVVSFSEVPGWTLEVLRGEAGRVVGAVWTGTLPPERFVELPFVAVNPDEEATLSWPVTQTYEGGEVVEWFGPEESEAPASVTRIRGAGGVPASAWIAAAAILLAILALGLALRPGRPPARA
jgi:uncharacterized protein YcnI